jgi:hypothetical protein
VIVHAELLPILILGVPPEVSFEVDDFDSIGTNVNEVDDSRDGDLLAIDREWQIRILLDS